MKLINNKVYYRKQTRISPSLFFGFSRIDHFYMATPEKALLDTLHLRKSLPTPDELEMENININSLKAMSSKFPENVVKGLSSLQHRIE